MTLLVEGVNGPFTLGDDMISGSRPTHTVLYVPQAKVVHMQSVRPGEPWHREPWHGEERRAWLTKERFLEGLALVNALPGAPAMQMCIFVGHQRAGWWGGVIAGLAFMAPTYLFVGCLLATIAIGAVKSLTDGPKNFADAVASPFWSRLLIAHDRKSSNAIVFMENKDPEKTKRVMEALLQMQKLDIPALEEAYAHA